MALEMALGRSYGRLALLFIVMLALSLAVDVNAAYDGLQRREAAVVDSTDAHYLRGQTLTIDPGTVSTELGARYESFEEFERRELVDSYPGNPADPNCDNDPSLCAP